MWTIVGLSAAALIGFVTGVKTIVAVFPLLQGQKLTPALSKAVQRQLTWIGTLWFGPGAGIWWLVPDYGLEAFLRGYVPALPMVYFATIFWRVGRWIVARADDMGAAE